MPATQNQSAPALLQRVLSASQNGVLVYHAVRDDEGIIVDLRVAMLNAVAERDSGKPAIDMLGQLYSRLFPSVAQAELFDRYRRVMETGEAARFELYYKLSTKTTADWFDISVMPLQDSIVVSYNNSTKAKMDDDAARQASALQQAFNSSLSGFTVYEALYDADGRIDDFRFVMINDAGLRMSGFTHEQLIGKTVWEIYPATGINGLFDQYVQVCQTGEPLLGETYYPEYDLWRAYTLVRVAGGVMINYTDITPQKKQEEIISRQAQMLHGILESVSAGIIVLKPVWSSLRSDSQIINFSFVLVNSAFQAAFSLGTTDVAGQLLTHLLPRSQESGLLSRCMMAAEMNHAHQFEMPNRTDGSTRWYLVTITTQGDQLILLLTDVTDSRQLQVTHHFQSELALRQSEQRYRSMVENINEVVYQTDCERKLIYLNPYWTTLTGYTIEESIGQIGDNFYGPQTDQLQTRQTFEDLMAQRITSARLEVRIQHKDGSHRWADLYMQVQVDAAGQPTGLAGLIADITDRKNRELMLQQSLEKEKALNQLKSQFVTTASHEFRTPLTTIQSSVELIKLYMDIPGEKVLPTIHRHLNVIEKEISHFSSLLSDVLTYGRIEAGKMPFNPEPTDLPTLIDELLTTHFSHRSDGRSVKVLLTGKSHLLQVDPKLLGHVLINLLTNAFKFSKTNPMLNVVFAPDRVQVMVIDKGIGIPADEQANLFSTFFRARNASNIQGTGMGLVIAREFVRQHEGDITVQSEENAGTTFTIALPATRPGAV
ncbi:PAS domain-containing sensor histidine kinase [Spirosoma pollinicola]|uniref:histidine kinase n=1 Tax=Spirosoma pollinicola TaxID=2057025 RepID=A0A2K8Z907_9BACT|nr:PAS domain S-box protein [Spirosoma pollinicola]AUD06334.1 hypothetical protein CWM47_33525 [Spirosoma pollinicola]